MIQLKHVAGLAFLALAACSESQEPDNPNAAAEAAEQKTDGTWDVGSATQEAVTDTQAAANEAAQVTGTATTTQQAIDATDQPMDPGLTEPDRVIGQ